MPPSEAFIEEDIFRKYSAVPPQTLIAGLIQWVDQLLALPSQPHRCDMEFAVGFAGSQSGISCSNVAITFCDECEREVCEVHRRMCCLTRLCPDCLVTHVHGNAAAVAHA